MAARTAEPYLSKYPDFMPDPQATCSDNFDGLAAIRDWAEGGRRWRKERREYLLSEYDIHLGFLDKDSKLEGYQDLCRELRVTSVPDSITKCKKILMFQVHVNLIDLIDSRRRHRQVKVFQSLTRLQTYTKNTEKYFPLGGAKKRPLLKILLRGMN